MFDFSGGKPGIQPTFTANPVEIFYSGRDRAQFWANPVTIDGTLSSNPQNTPYTFELFAGTLLGRVTATQKLATSILGLTASAITGASSTTVTTDVNTAAELVRRIGTSGTFTIYGPATSGGTAHTETVTYSAVNLSTGVITITATTNSYESGVLIQPTDGSQTPITLICSLYGVKCADGTNVNRVDAFCPQLLLAGGTINDSKIVSWPTDTTIQSYIKTSLKSFCGGVTFLSDLV